MGTAGLGPAARSTSRRQQTRDLVLDTALRLFTERGYLGVRVEDIAKEAGVSRATFYQHFAEREQVLAELFQRLLGDEDTAPEPPAGSHRGRSTQQQVLALLEETVRRMLDQEQLARFVYSLPVRHSALLRPGVSSTPPVFGRVATLLEHGVVAGDVRDDVPVPLLTRQVGMALETAMRDWAEGQADDPLDQLRLMVGLAFTGIAGR